MVAASSARPLLARALPLRARSALIVRHELAELIREQFARARPLIRGALWDLRGAMSLDDLEDIARREASRVSKADVDDIGDAAVVAAVGRIAKRTLVAGLRAGRAVAVRHVPAAIAPPARALTERATITERATLWAEQRSSALVVGIDESTRAAVRAAMKVSVQNGLHIDSTAKLLRDVIPLDERRARGVANYRARLAADGVKDEIAERKVAAYAEKMVAQRAEVIARTECFSSINEGRADLWRELADEGVISEAKVVRQWLTSRDERLCGDCEALDNETAGLNEAFSDGTEMPPAHPACVVGETLVSAGGVLAVSARRFEGDLVTLRTRSGECLTVTPNHPVLTDRGWVPARIAHEAGHVLRLKLGRSTAIGAAADHDQHVPARIEEIANALRMKRGVVPREVPVATPDFHGDGRGSQIAVVLADPELRRRLDSAVSEHLAKSLFKNGGAGDVALAALGQVTESVERPLDAAHGGVCGADLPGALFERHAGPLGDFGCALPAWLEADIAQANLDAGSSGTHDLRDLIDGLAGLEESNHRRVIESTAPQQSAPGSSSGSHAADLQAIKDEPWRDTQEAGRLLQRLSGLVDRDDIIGVDVASGSAHVYNLQTVDGWYTTGNGIVNHNCRCTVLIEVDL